MFRKRSFSTPATSSASSHSTIDTRGKILVIAPRTLTGYYHYLPYHRGHYRSSEDQVVGQGAPSQGGRKDSESSSPKRWRQAGRSDS